MDRWFPIETERLLLREFRAEDEQDIHAYASDPEVVRLMIWGPNSLETTQTFLAGVLKEQERWPRPAVSLAIELKSERRVIGGIDLRVKDEKNRAANIGYVLARAHWGQGYMVEAGRAVLDAAFRHVGLHRVWATCDSRNSASYRVMEKLGMRREAHFRKDVMEKGEWRDSYLYAILADDWLGANSSGD
ncbi:MAG TPA: GNAT family protein [Candidatus Acidoferrum sp.]|nr:GNAT family protein [Candidatus Acidoferrum sp.]